MSILIADTVSKILDNDNIDELEEFLKYNFMFDKNVNIFEYIISNGKKNIINYILEKYSIYFEENRISLIEKYIKQNIMFDNDIFLYMLNSFKFDNVYDSFKIINSIIFSDSDISKNDKINYIYIIFEKLFNDIERGFTISDFLELDIYNKFFIENIDLLKFEKLLKRKFSNKDVDKIITSYIDKNIKRYKFNILNLLKYRETNKNINIYNIFNNKILINNSKLLDSNKILKNQNFKDNLDEILKFFNKNDEKKEVLIKYLKEVSFLYSSLDNKNIEKEKLYKKQLNYLLDSYKGIILQIDKKILINPNILFIINNNDIKNHLIKNMELDSNRISTILNDIRFLEFFPDIFLKNINVLINYNLLNNDYLNLIEENWYNLNEKDLFIINKSIISVINNNYNEIYNKDIIIRLIKLFKYIDKKVINLDKNLLYNNLNDYSHNILINYLISNDLPYIFIGEHILHNNNNNNNIDKYLLDVLIYKSIIDTKEYIENLNNSDKVKFIYMKMYKNFVNDNIESIQKVKKSLDKIDSIDNKLNIEDKNIILYYFIIFKQSNKFLEYYNKFKDNDHKVYEKFRNYYYEYFNQYKSNEVDINLN